MIWILLLGCADYNGPLSATTLYAGTSAPSRVHATFHLSDADGVPVADWLPEEFAVSQDGADVDAQVRTWDELDPHQPVVLLLDVSSDGDLDAVKQVAQGFLDARHPTQTLAIATFSDSSEMVRGLTADPELLQAALDGVTTGSGVSDVYTAVADRVGTWTDDLSPSTGYTRGALVVITDGGSQPSVTPLGTVTDARGDQLVIVVSLVRAGGDLDQIANGGVVWVKDPSEAQAATTQGVALLDGARQGMVFASWCSDARSGLQTVTATFKRGTLGATFEESVDMSGLSDGTPFDTVTDLSEPIEGVNSRVMDGILYVGGGDQDGSSYYAHILPDGRLGSFHEGPFLDLGQAARFHAGEGALWAFNGDQEGFRVPVVDGVPGTPEAITGPPYAEVVRSHDGLILSIEGRSVYSASVSDPNTWTESAPYPIGLEGYIGAAVAGDRLYVFGSTRDSINEDYRLAGFSAPVSDMSSWDTASVPADYPGYWFEVDSDGERLVLFPGDDGDSQAVWTATPEGASVSWTQAGSLSTDRRFYGVGTAPDGRIFIHAGEVEGSTSAEGLVTQLADDGTLALDCMP